MAVSLRLLAVSTIALALAACSGSTPSSSPAATPTPTLTVGASPSPSMTSAAPSSSAIEGMFDVGGYSMWLSCTSGVEGPTVVLESGLGMTNSTWGLVIADLGPTIPTCRYDRAGIAASDRRPSDAPVSVGSMADELHRLLEAAGIAGPYVIVGHSYGGMIARVFAHRNRDDTVGLVLVDASTAFRLEGDTSLNDEPWVDRSSVVDETSSQVELAAIDTLDPLPLIVLTAGQFEGDFDGVAWTRSQAELATLSSDSLHMVARDSGHGIQQMAYRLVAEAVRAVLDAAATGGRLPPCDARFTDVGAACIE